MVHFSSSSKYMDSSFSKTCMATDWHFKLPWDG